MSLNNEITSLLKREGCNIVGFADLRCLSKDARQGFDCGILIALPYTKDAILDNKNGKPERYYSEYSTISSRLSELAMLTADFLRQHRYKALPKTPSMVVQDEDHRTVLPHKTIATLAGVGWIGKCALLVTNKAGSALRLIVVLTDAPLDCGNPITDSMCPPDCTICADVCPGNAPLGAMWKSGLDRESFFNAQACRSAARSRAKEMLNIEETICGLCIAYCPFTKKGLGYEWVIKQLNEPDLDFAAEIIRASFSTVAEEFGLTRENAPTHTSFITAERLRSHFMSAWLMYGFYNDGLLVGYVSLSEENSSVYEMHNLAVLPEQRHHGYGKQLVDFCREMVLVLGGKKITISIIEENIKVRNWYASLGFQHTGTKRFPHLPFTTGYMEWEERT